MGRTWAQYGHATYPLHDRIPGLGHFKIQIPRRETNFTDEVLNKAHPPCQCVDGVQIAGTITTKPSSARWFSGYRTSYLYSIHTLTKQDLQRSMSPVVIYTNALVLTP